MSKEKPLIRYIESNLQEADVPSMQLPGTIAGFASRAESEDGNFQKISTTGAGEGVIFDDENIKKFQDASEKMYKGENIYGGIIDGFVQFVIGKGVAIEADDENEKVKEYVNEFIEENGFNGLDKKIVTTTLIDGECFIRIFRKGDGDKDAIMPMVKLLYYWEIGDIKRDPKDRNIALAYIRYYMKDGKQEKEEIPAEDIVHVRVDCMAENRGLPPFARIMQMCGYYADLVHTRLVLNRIKASFYLEEIVDGSASSTTAQDGMASDTVKTSKSGKNMKRMPKPGSKLVHNKAVEYKWLTPTVDGADAQPDARMLRLSICAGAQCPEFLLGDASNNSYSSTLVAQNPFVRKCEGYQDSFAIAFNDLFGRIIQHGIDMKEISNRSKQTVITEKARNVNVWRRVKAMWLKEQVADSGDLFVEQPIDTKTTVTCTWQNLITQDILQESQAYQVHQSMGLVSKQTLRGKLGYDHDLEEKLIAHEEANSNPPESDNPGLTPEQRKAELAQQQSDQNK